MAASIFDSPLYAQLFPTGETGRLFSDSAALRAMLLVEGALAKAQGQIGIIPEISAAAIHRASLEIQIDPGAIAKATGQNGVCVPGLVASFCSEMNAPEHAQYVHWGATSQDIMDTGLMLRLRQALLLAEADILTVLKKIADEAEHHADSPMAARTFNQVATPTTWGAVLAQWGDPLCDALDALPALRQGSLWVSLSGASGTAAALGDTAPHIRRSLSMGLGLIDPERSWHTDRSPMNRIADWLASITNTLGALGTTLIGLAGSDNQEVSFETTGNSSTMPQKKNPIAATALVALSHQMSCLRTGMSMAAAHQHQRDGAAWFTEWMLLPQIVLCAASSLQQAKKLSQTTVPNITQMKSPLYDQLGLMQAEALSFALCGLMPRSNAKDVTKDLCTQAMREGRPLASVANEVYPNISESVFNPAEQLGQSPNAARQFAARVRAF
ncbi:MAG: lyase family protein [Roseobacter sp.]